jgi:pimeloyl-ACP methyl ester carboxylesterase
MRGLSTADRFSVFSYDWRASNSVSAEKLEEFVCDLKDPNTPIVFIAHSMGGLVLKHWMKDHYETGCGKKLKIGRIVFVGTPHLGAPKAFAELISGIDLFGFSVVDAVVSRGINHFGLSFDSLYELLPFTNSYVSVSEGPERCFQHKESYGLRTEDAFRDRVVFKQSKYEDFETLDIFSVSVLERLGVVERVAEMLSEIGSKEEPRKYLESKLENARDVTCSLSKFEL